MLQGSLPEVFLDTDVSFDIISKREPHYDSSVKLLDLAARDKIRLMISESSLANLFYLTFDIYKITDAVAKLSDLVIACELASGRKDNVLLALKSTFKDKEDALQYYTALHAKADYFITRNLKDYVKHSTLSLPVYSPNQFLKEIGK
jgi:predicted nucleic acid-binding protein